MEVEKCQDALPGPEFYKRNIKGIAITFTVLSGVMLVFAILEVCFDHFISRGMMFGLIGSVLGLIINMWITLKTDNYSLPRCRGICISSIISAVLLGLYLIGQVVRIIIILVVQPEEGNKRAEAPYIAMGCIMVIELVFICILFVLATVMAVITGHNLTERCN